MDLEKDLLETWDIHHQVTIYLLKNIDSDWLSINLENQGRSVGEQFVHINNIRSMWVNKVGEKEDLKIEKKKAKDKLALEKALNYSARKMRIALKTIFSQEKVKGYKPHAAAFFGQMIAHESHHRGQIMTIIKRNNLPISKSVNFGLWGWNTKLKK